MVPKCPNFLALACLFVMVAECSAVTLVANEGEDSQVCSAFSGFDYKGQVIHKIDNVKDWTACCDLCKDNDRCKAYTFIKNSCWLMSASGYLRLYPEAYTQKFPFVCSAIKDADYLGNDLKRIDGVADWPACCTLCEKEPRCKAYSFLGHSCWLKSQAANYRYYAKAFTQKLYAPKCDPIPNKDYFGGDIRKLDNIDTPEVCCDFCELEPKCKGYTWNKESKSCYLKHTLNDLRDSPVSYTQKFPEPVPSAVAA